MNSKTTIFAGFYFDEMPWTENTRTMCNQKKTDFWSRSIGLFIWKQKLKKWSECEMISEIACSSFSIDHLTDACLFNEESVFANLWKLAGVTNREDGWKLGCSGMHNRLHGSVQQNLYNCWETDHYFQRSQWYQDEKREKGYTNLENIYRPRFSEEHLRDALHLANQWICSRDMLFCHRKDCCSCAGLLKVVEGCWWWGEAIICPQD